MKLVVLGHPVGHSLSPAMMIAALRSAQIPGTYGARDIAPPLERIHLDALRAEGVHGANVTLPHKMRALAIADTASEDARACGAANVLIDEEGAWHAENTDGPGFLDWLDEVPAARARVQRALVLGAGGAARAILGALALAGARRVTVVNRTRARAAALAREFANRIAIEIRDDARDAPIDDALVVQCTSLGLRTSDPLPLGRDAIARAGCVLDLVYPETALVKEARASGVPAEDGLGLLVAQGARAFVLWTGICPDRAAMRQAALVEILRRRA